MELLIKNFKCFEEQSIPLGQLTVLAGANSVGKSSVVQALLLLRCSVDNLWKEHFLDAKPSVPLNGAYHLNLGNSSEVLNRAASEPKIKIALLDNPVEISQEFLVPEGQSNYSLERGAYRAVAIEDKKLPIVAEAFYYLIAERIGPRIRHEVDDLSYPHCGWQGEYTIQIIGERKTTEVAQERCRDAEQIQNLLHQTRLWLDFITPGISIDDATLFSGIKTADATFAGSKATNVGFGISYVLPIIVNGLIAKKGSMYIVENPEAHLHPFGQSQIGKFLAAMARAGLQVVVETHSEHVINGIRIAVLTGMEDTLPHASVCINFFSRESGKVRLTTISLNDKADLSEWPRGFFDQQERDLAQIFRQKRGQP